MKYIRKAFLLLVGAVAIAIEETSKSIEEAARSLDDQREKLTIRRKA